jgi:anti-sigma B factor antagonist
MTFVVKDYERGDDIHVVCVAGAFDMHAAPMVKQTFAAALGTGRRHVVVDLCEATFIDSTAIGVLIGVTKKLRRSRNGSLSIACTNLNVIATFEMAGLASAMPVRLAMDDAVAALELATAL